MQESRPALYHHQPIKPWSETLPGQPTIEPSPGFIIINPSNRGLKLCQVNQLSSRVLAFFPLTFDTLCALERTDSTLPRSGILSSKK